MYCRTEISHVLVINAFKMNLPQLTGRPLQAMVYITAGMAFLLFG